MKPLLFNELRGKKYLHKINKLHNVQVTRIPVEKVNIFNIIPFIICIVLSLYLYCKYNEKQHIKTQVLTTDTPKIIKTTKTTHDTDIDIDIDMDMDIEKLYKKYNNEKVNKKMQFKINNPDEIDINDIDYIDDPLQYHIHKKNKKNKEDVTKMNKSEYHILEN